MDLPIDKHLMYWTARITCIGKNGESTGTGFFAELEFGGDQTTTIFVTNKHVIEGSESGSFIVHLAEEKDGVWVPLKEFHTISFKSEAWVPHPDPEVDLCALPITSTYVEIENKTGKRVFAPAVTKKISINSEYFKNMASLEEVIMIGYPIGLWDNENNFPIFRKGVTATDPAIDYKGKKEFLIDMACFPGSSGSPVFIYSNGAYRSSSSIMFGNRLIFVGILYAGPVKRFDGSIEIIQTPTAEKPIALTALPINLGIVIKAEKVFEFEKILSSPDSLRDYKFYNFP